MVRCFDHERQIPSAGNRYRVAIENSWRVVQMEYIGWCEYVCCGGGMLRSGGGGRFRPREADTERRHSVPLGNQKGMAGCVEGVSVLILIRGLRW